jgi:trimeric autotransporter adhesin
VAKGGIVRILFLICIFVFTISCSCFAAANYTESLTITTYYPSPYGVYGVLKLNPRPRPVTCKEGEMTYGNNTVPQGIYYCNSTNQWAQLGGSEFWVEDTATHYIHNSNTGGRVGIGTTAPTERLEVNGNIKATGNVAMNGDMLINGNITAAAFFYSSDLKLKKNIRPLKGSLDRVSRLQGIAFRWRNNNREDIGLAAQEVEKVYPELVSTDRNTGLKSVEYGNLIAVLIESIKEQQEQIRELKAEVAGFKK